MIQMLRTMMERFLFTKQAGEYILYPITVEPLNKGHFGSRGFVLFSEVVLWWEVQANRSFIYVIYLDNMF